MHPFSSRAKDAPAATSLDQLSLVYAMVDHIQRARRVEHVYQEAADGLRSVLSADRSLLLTQEGGEGMHVRAWAGVTPESRNAMDGFSPWPRSGLPPATIEIRDLGAEKQGQPVYEALRAEGIHAAAWLPLLHRGRLLGALFLGRTTRRPFEASELRLAEVIAGHVAFSIWRTRSDEDQAELLRRFEAERSVLESVVKQMPAGVLLADVPSGRIITSNPQVTAIWGKSLQHAQKVSDYAMWGGLDAEGSPLDPRSWPLARSVERGETVAGEEIRIGRGEGSFGIVRMSSAPVVDGRGRQLAAVATVFDVTREREQELRTAFLEDATQMLNRSVELDATLAVIARVTLGRYADWSVLYRTDSDSLQVVTAEHRQDEVTEPLRPFRERSLPLDGSEPISQAVLDRNPLLATDEPTDAERAIAGTDEERLQAARSLGCRGAVVLPLTARDRELGALCLVRAEEPYSEDDLELMAELARRASLAMENALLYERARAADRAKANFLAVMSHEFRTPLSAILGYADILTARVHGELNPKQATHLDRVKASVRHLSHLVDEILSFASMEAGRERFIAGSTEMRALVVDSTGIMEPIAEAAGLAFRVELPSEEVTLRTDASKVRQIVINLISNALKYTLEGEVVVELTSSEAGVHVRVTDTGPGIAPEHVERVFEPFWQVEQSEGRRITGTGLGLAVGRQLSRLLGGDLTLESEVGKGSRFTLTLPWQPPGVAGERAS